MLIVPNMFDSGGHGLDLWNVEQLIIGLVAVYSACRCCHFIIINLCNWMDRTRTTDQLT